MKPCNRRISRYGLLITAALWIAQSASGQPTSDRFLWQPYDESAELAQQQAHDNTRMRFRLINSRFLDKNSLWEPFEAELADFTESSYERLKPLVLEADIPSLQRAVADGRLTYETLVKFYVYRLREIESDNTRSLNAFIAINPRAIEIARRRDMERTTAGFEVDDYSIYGIPVLLKDNIGTSGMPTTAGALVLRENRAGDAFVTGRLEANGAIILGKANLSEWAYFFCEGCPLGYSAMGGQTLNPYGRKLFESGGSSSGSAVAVAANLATVAVGSETSGSILSPASLNSTVGLKPTTGLLSRTGVIPIAGSLDTLGPIARSVTDAIILFNAMTGYDSRDLAMPRLAEDARLLLEPQPLTGRRLGYLPALTEVGAYQAVLERLRESGAELVEITLPEAELPRFGEFLGAEMQRDLPRYLTGQGDDELTVASLQEIVAFNSAGDGWRAPYGQALFDEMVGVVYTEAERAAMLAAIRGVGGAVLSQPMATQRLDALLSINNFHAGVAAAANFPALTIPLGLREDGRPLGLTLIAPSFGEQALIDLALPLEALIQGRRMPTDYQ